MIYSRSLNEVSFGDSVTEFSIKDLKETSSIVSYATNFNSHTVAKKIRDYSSAIKTNVNYQGHKNIEFDAKNLITLSDNDLIKNRTIEIIKLADFGITDFFTADKEKHEIATILGTLRKQGFSKTKLKELEKSYENNTLSISEPFFKHKIGNAHQDFSPIKESSGTIQFFALTSMMLPVLETGGLIVIDEIEIKLHQNLVAYLIGLFQNPEVNKGSAQLIFTFHNSLFMDILQPEQLWFAEKNNKGETELFCAANFVDIEEIHKKSLEKLYRIGRFGAKPKGI